MKSPTQNNELTQAESELYDRQIRLWGVESQKRLRLARVLIIGVQGYGCEVAKNIILSGVHSVKLLDAGVVTELDACAQFLAPRDQIGQNRAEASLARAQQLNPMVQVTADKDSVDDKPDSFFEDFYVICATRCTTEQLIRIDRICRKKKALFFCGDVFGMFGYSFADLGEHNFEKTTTTYPVTGAGDANKGDNKVTITTADTSSYISLESALEDERAKEAYARQQTKMDPSYLLLKVLLRFRAEHGRDPLPSLRIDDSAALLALRDSLLGELGVPPAAAALPDAMLADVFAEVAPVCAVLGGVMGQEIIKAVSRREEPHKNFFFFNPIKCLGFVENITLPEKQ